MMLQNEDFLLTHPAEVSKQFFDIKRIVFHLSIKHSAQMKETHNSMELPGVQIVDLWRS